MELKQVKLRWCAQANIVAYLLLVLTGPVAFGAEVLNLYTVNYPLAYFAQRIGGQHVNVQFPAPQDVDPAFWKPDVKTVGHYQTADLILLNGAGYARWTQKVSLPRSRMVNTSAKFAERFLAENSEVTHSHGPTGDHSHTGTAFTTWLDMRQAIMQANAIMHALIRRQPHNEAEFVENYEALEGDLLNLDKLMAGIIAKDPTRPILASHPVYQYFARRYSLDMKSVMWEPDKFPTPAEWSAFSLELKTHPAKFMFWEARPLKNTMKELGQQNVQAVIFKTCANVPQAGDFLSVMQQNAQSLKAVYSH